MKPKLDAVVVVVLAVILWSASQRSSAECNGGEDSHFALNLVDAGGDPGWPEEATLVVWVGTSTPRVSVDAGKQGVLHAEGN